MSKSFVCERILSKTAKYPSIFIRELILQRFLICDLLKANLNIGFHIVLISTLTFVYYFWFAIHCHAGWFWIFREKIVSPLNYLLQLHWIVFTAYLFLEETALNIFTFKNYIYHIDWNSFWYFLYKVGSLDLYLQWNITKKTIMLRVYILISIQF